MTAGEAEMAGPWRVEPIPGAGFGVYRAGEGAGRGFRPVAVFRRRSVALLAASVLPGTGRDRAFLLQTEEDPAGGYAVQDGSEVAGHLDRFDDRLIEAIQWRSASRGLRRLWRSCSRPRGLSPWIGRGRS